VGLHKYIFAETPLDRDTNTSLYQSISVKIQPSGYSLMMTNDFFLYRTSPFSSIFPSRKYVKVMGADKMPKFPNLLKEG
jgi:hypothetical protein